MFSGGGRRDSLFVCAGRHYLLQKEIDRVFSLAGLPGQYTYARMLRLSHAFGFPVERILLPRNTTHVRVF